MIMPRPATMLLLLAALVALPSPSSSSSEVEIMASDIRQAIQSGVPMWNSGHINACVDIYRAVVTKHADNEPILASALDAATHQSVESQGWTFRRAMDTVLANARHSMAAANDKDEAEAAEEHLEGEDSEKMLSAIRNAIARGVPLWNAGDTAGCTAHYYEVVRAFVDTDPTGHLAYGLKKAERAALVCPSRTSQGWLLRRAMDRVLGAAAALERAMVEEASSDAAMMVSIIEEVIREGSMAWDNNGDQGVKECTTMYRHVVERFAEDEPLLAGALEAAEHAAVDSGLQSQGWIFRRAMDAVLAEKELDRAAAAMTPIASSSESSDYGEGEGVRLTSGGGEGEEEDPGTVDENRQMVADLNHAVRTGVPMWNGGDRAGCVEVYRAVISKYTRELSEEGGPAYNRLSKSLSDADGKTVTEQGWIFRYAIDDVLAGCAGGWGDADDHARDTEESIIQTCGILIGAPLVMIIIFVLGRYVQGNTRQSSPVDDVRRLSPEDGTSRNSVQIAVLDPDQSDAGSGPGGPRLGTAVIVSAKKLGSGRNGDALGQQATLTDGEMQQLELALEVSELSTDGPEPVQAAILLRPVREGEDAL